MLKLKQSLLSVIIGLALAAGISYAWTGPTANPTGGNVSAPINVRGDNEGGAQTIADTKTLTIGDGTKVLGITGALLVRGLAKADGGVFTKGGTNKDNGQSVFPWTDGKNYIRGTTIIAENDQDNMVGIGTASPQAKLDVAGVVKIGNSTASPVAGSIRWTGADFEGYDGTQWKSFTVSGTGQSQEVKSQKFTASGTFTVPTGVTTVWVTMTGGGGGGGGVFNMAGAGGGGGASDLISNQGVSVLSGSNVSVIVGDGGARGTSGNGGNGGTSSFGSFVSIPGGNGGQAGSHSNFGAGGSIGGGAGYLSKEVFWRGGDGGSNGLVVLAGFFVGGGPGAIHSIPDEYLNGHNAGNGQVNTGSGGGGAAGGFGAGFGGSGLVTVKWCPAGTVPVSGNIATGLCQ